MKTDGSPFRDRGPAGRTPRLPSPRVWRDAAAQAASRIGAATEGYDRIRLLPRLIAIDPSTLDDGSGPLAPPVLARLKRALRDERRRGRAGHWAYDLNRHLALRQAIEAEETIARHAAGPAVPPSRALATPEPAALHDPGAMPEPRAAVTAASQPAAAAAARPVSAPAHGAPEPRYAPAPETKSAAQARGRAAQTVRSLAPKRGGSLSGCACRAAGRGPSSWRARSARPHSSAQPSDSPPAGPTSRDTPRATCCTASADGA